MNTTQLSSGTNSDEIARFLANIRADGEDSTEIADPSAPRVVFPALLTLTREQEDALIARAQGWITDLSTALGRDRVAVSEENYMASASLTDLDDFFGRRRIFELLYHGRVQWRKNIPASIFAAGHNLHMPIVRRIVQQQIARASNYFFSTEPWFSANPQGDADEIPAERINRYAQFKFRQARVRNVFERAVETALIRGEGIVKTTSVRKSRFYKDQLDVAIDPVSGEPLIATDGDYIQRKDKWIAATTEDGQIEMDEQGNPVMLLERAPDTVMPPGELQFQVGVYERERVVYSGPQADTVYYLDFLCPETATDVQEAPFVAHLYDMPASQITQAYLQRLDATGNDPARPRIIELLRQAASMRPSEPAAATGPRPEDGVVSSLFIADYENQTGKVPVAECYLTMDVDGDGQPEEVMLILNRETWEPIYYEYTDRVTPKGERPFHVVRVNPVDGRWYGNSQVDLFWYLQMAIDLAMNRWNLSQSESGRVTAFQPEACYEGDGNPNLMMNRGRVFRLKPGNTIDDLVQVKYLSDIKGADLKTQIEFFMQISQSMSGVTNANDASMAGLDQTKLATGIRNLEKSGQELFAPLLSHLEVGLSNASSALLRLLAAGMEEAEIYQFFEGEVRTVEEIRPDEIEGLDFVAEMELTRYKNEQTLYQNMSAIDLVDKFYLEHPQKQALLLPMYRNILKLYGVDHADRFLQPGFQFPPAGTPQNPDMGEQAIAPRPTGKSEPNL